MIFEAAALTGAFHQRYAQTGTVDLQASGTTVPEPDFGKSDTVDGIQAVGVNAFGTTAKMRVAKAQRHFLVLGETVKKGDVVQLPETDFLRMESNGQVVEATPEDIAAAQKGSKK